MQKSKLISSDNEDGLTQSLDQFLKEGHKMILLKFTTASVQIVERTYNHGTRQDDIDYNNHIQYSVLVIYEEKD